MYTSLIRPIASVAVDHWMLQEDEDVTSASVADKGKGKERDEFDLGEDKGFPESTIYPPMSEDAEETRRVEEVSTSVSNRYAHVLHAFG